MANIYIALNGDGVGERIGNAIAQDDHEEVASATSAIDSAHGNIDQWVESVGGRKVTRSGDEGIYIISDKALADLESIKGSYKEQTGHGLTIGVGSSMSEASKALIYGKLNGKDQIVHYEPMIEDYLSDEDVSDEEIPEDVPMDSDEDSDQNKKVPFKGDSQKEEDEESVPTEAEVPEQSEEESEESEDSEEEGKEFAEEPDEDETSKPSFNQEEGEENEEGEEDESSIPEQDDLSDDNQKASESPIPPKSLDVDSDEDENDEDENDEDELEENEEDTQDPDAPGSKAIDGDVDGKDFGADKDESDQEDQDDEALDATDTSMTPKNSPVEGEESVYQDLSQDDVADPGMDAENEKYNQNDALTDMIHGDLENDDSSEEMPGDEGSSDQAMNEGQPVSQLDEELRQDIASALMAFKENKDMLEQAREQNPKLYQATITMLRSMIEMAKKLGQNPEQDMQDQENETQLNDEFPAAEDQEDDVPGTPPAQPDVGGMSAEKKQ